MYNLYIYIYIFVYMYIDKAEGPISIPLLYNGPPPVVQ